MSEIEREIEQELHRVLDPIAAQPIPPRRAIVQNRRTASALLGGAGAALSLKLLTGVAVAAAAVTVAGAATTGSLNPSVWGQQGTQRVQECKDKLADGQHGIGDCVSSFASQHGAAVAPAARHHGNANGHDNANGNGNANGHDKDKSHSTPKDQSVAPPRLEPEPVDQADTRQPVNISPRS
ncbi:MAG: hypothetical protein E6I30_08745 [Chloroflexi bacterium]|nr:MAG: hypothetical protein E6I30_08745 [Chloroflexota bacterium]TMG58083.1 MAG: hypothetical protein E6H83_13500 [Chloroflexota bacterium]